MRIITADSYLEEERNTTTLEQDNQNLDKTVLEIIQKVRQTGDQSLYDYTEAFDGVKLTELLVSEEEFTEAAELVDGNFINSLRQAKQNIEEFHQKQLEKSWFFHKSSGITLGQMITPIGRAGIYIPGGKAAYPSSVLMNVIPAKLAQVEEIAIVTPPQKDGKVNPYVLTAAREVGVDTVYKIGGAQAIAALAYGTETVSKVDKIVGPGNAFVARAKKWVFGDVAIDMIAGPSEICVAADGSAPTAYIAADLLSQAEHDERARTFFITNSTTLAEKVRNEMYIQLEMLERKDIIKASLQDFGRIIITKNEQETFDLINQIAPEHLELMMENASDKLPFVKNAGAIFLGNYSPEPLGDYFAGPNHTLPTSGTAAFSSPLGVYDFMKKSSIIQYSQEALLKASEPIIHLAETEGLTAHANAIYQRRDGKNAQK
ncbi:Histidinol dehydrogenase [Oceanobacillus picturae]|uniref:Histidinol dehydrogenase n=2 Tax=Oceanobacillus TaxID=182709 RepID=W9BCF5_9BACI|nr:MULTISPECIES: histidinol dehydrogenase [Oceanobacillus]MCG3419304.1 histidinol dehydrogenase [Oceanobacillus jordanicus]RIU88555.1 histidinol dehydrogenase [Oceanobacillus picturae]CDO04035.1 Histidinol dehydrogenase [Oceanobacillus picturae]